nr:hypothetical protein [Tanacetum cinerariifolium]
DDDDDDEQTDSDNDGDDFLHPKFSTHDEEDKDEESFDLIVQTPSQVKNTDDEDNDENSHGMNVEGDEGAKEYDEANELYRDININLAGRDVQMADVQTTQVIEDTHVTLTSVNPEGQQQSSSVSSRFILNMLNPSLDTVGKDELLEVGAQLELHESILHDHTQRLDALPLALFEGYDMDFRESYTRSWAVRDEIFSQRYRLRSLEQERKGAIVTFSAIWRPMLALESWAGHVDAKREEMWRARRGAIESSRLHEAE